MEQPNPSLRIVQATAEMLDGMYSLERKVWSEQDSCSRESLAKRIELLPESIPVAFIGDKLVGYSTCARLPLNHKVDEYYQAFYPWDRIHDTRGEILYFYSSTVDPDFRMHGIWKELVKFRVNYALNNQDINKIWVACRTKQNYVGPDTSRLMEKMGFTKIKEIPDSEEKDVPMALLELLPPYRLKI